MKLAVLLNPTWGYRIYMGSSTWSLDFILLILELEALRDLCWRRHWSTMLFRIVDLDKVALIVIDKYPLPPLLIPARTTHSRFFPKKHSFSYSYFYVGIPIGWKGRAGSSLSADVDLLPQYKRQYGWFNVNSDDYLHRGPAKGGLEGKLRTYLQSQGVQDEDWDFAYLCTAPRFLSYSFNPVSFWYIYDSRSQLVMMVLEVNNTFGERRMYLLKVGEGIGQEDGDATVAESNRFRDSWTKDFHVSPFNSRKGSYSLQAKNPRTSGDALKTAIDNTITLRSSKGGTKLVARVFSEGQALDPTTLTTLQLSRLVASWFWVGFLTFPRILYEAYRLFFKHKLHVWYRPEVLASSISRQATAEELRLEPVIRRFFQQQVEQYPSRMEVTYTPPADMGPPQVWKSINNSSSTTPLEECELRILSPAFYSRFVHYAHTAEALDREGRLTDEKNRTVAVEPPAVFDKCVRQRESSDFNGKSRKNDVVDEWRWKILRRLRCAPPAVSYGEAVAGTDSGVTVSDIRVRALSALDRYVRTSCEREDSEVYRRTVCKLFIAQRWAGGFTPLITAADWVLRLLLVAGAYRGSVLSVAGADSALGAIFAGFVGLVLGNAVHVWSFVKGS
ncbi:hypothetical protein K461DRAFT_287825 [Myriangium duriaei CBS 260.36]|uniref:DUF1365 domain-containing protein n=1 Tax=Myriangium duriaei CBS 260.36 TaxID=1168546 RepID=A0A9P4IYW7_9PEZI|nr:hypothetical protein K461DRAFT_287825 [Myriangium duriaei CBS 260.36]